jgi:hypothetical protein
MLVAVDLVDALDQCSRMSLESGRYPAPGHLLVEEAPNVEVMPGRCDRPIR